MSPSASAKPTADHNADHNAAPPGQPRASVHGRGRELLLAAASELFGERGYAGTSTRDIAERAGVTEPMLFRHFGNKANLFQEAAVTPFVEFMDRYIADYRAREHGRLTAEQEGRRLYEGLFAALREQREPLMALLSAGRFAPVADEVSEQMRGAFAQVITLFEEVVETESHARGFTDPDLPATVRVMFGMVLSAALHDDWMALGGGPGDHSAHDRMLDAMTRMAVRGLGAG
jgi:AcrR family transcriptional regulator